MSLKQKQERLEEVKLEIKKLYELLTPFQEESRRLVEEIRKLEFESLLPLTCEKVMTTSYQVFETKETYKELQRFLQKYKFIMCEGYMDESQTKALKIKLSQKAPLKDQIQEVMEFLPFLAKVDYSVVDKYQRFECPELQGQIRVVSVFEHTCSENGSYSLLVGDNDMAALLRVRYSSPKILKVLPIEKMIEYVRENHPYELTNEN